MRMLIVLLALLLNAPALAQSALPAAPYADRQIEDPALERKARTLMETIRCLTCQSQSIADSNASMAGDMRSQIRERIMAGEEPEHIWPLWAAPLILLGLGLLLLRGRIRRRRRS